LTDTFFWADTDVFQFSMLITDADTNIFVLLKQNRGKKNTPGALLPSAKHFQTTVERHYSHSVYFSSGHIKEIISQVTIIL